MSVISLVLYGDVTPEPKIVDMSVVIEIISCEKQATLSLRTLIDQQVAAIQQQYQTKCLTAPFNDELTIDYGVSYYHFTLYYHDRAGNLIRTVPPNGVIFGVTSRSQHPAHSFVTANEYNSLGQLISTTSPDAGRKQFWYNDKGQIRFSQDARQAAAKPWRFNYINYDKLGRAVESGEGLEPIFNSVRPGIFATFVPGSVNGNTNPVIGGRERTVTVYSTPAPSFVGYLGQLTRQQRYLQNRVSYTLNDDAVLTLYSYDPHGNVEWSAQYIPGLGTNFTGYRYDLISGNMLEAHYDSSVVDQFHQRYSYDEDNRLVKVESSRDGLIWDCDAGYDYYKHGPLRKIELGEDKLQSLEYTYTIEGWLKGINHPSLVQDASGSTASVYPYAPDAFGMALGYYAGDFLRKSGTAGSSSFNSATTGPTGVSYTKSSYALTGGDLYNGNISSWSSNIIPSTVPQTPALQNQQLTGYSFRYDVLNRLLRSDFRVYGSGGSTPGGAQLAATRALRGKEYEMKDHLGDIRVVIGDLKLRLMPPSSGLQFTVDLHGYNNYYPFGMVQPERSFNLAGYRYGFNGKENDDDVKGEGKHQDYGMRMYDPRAGRFLSVDPLASSYPKLTPYQFAGNMSIKFIDLTIVWMAW